jgi:hypothetical protein
MSFTQTSASPTGHAPESRRPTAPAVAYWLGNPLLNPAVVVFLLFVAPWQWTVTRLVVAADHDRLLVSCVDADRRAQL